MIRIERAVVTGGRNFTDGTRIEADLRALLPLGLRRVAQGGNGIDKQFGGAECPKEPRSADALAWLATCAIEGLDEATYRVNMTTVEPGDGGRAPRWTGEDGRDRRAPLRRNTRMLRCEKPDLVLAYPDEGSRGTWHCVKQALLFGHPVALWCPWLTREGIGTAVRVPSLICDDDPRWLLWLPLVPCGAKAAMSFLARTLRGDA